MKPRMVASTITTSGTADSTSSSFPTTPPVDASAVNGDTVPTETVKEMNEVVNVGNAFDNLAPLPVVSTEQVVQVEGEEKSPWENPESTTVSQDMVQKFSVSLKAILNKGLMGGKQQRKELVETPNFVGVGEVTTASSEPVDAGGGDAAADDRGAAVVDEPLDVTTSTADTVTEDPSSTVVVIETPAEGQVDTGKANTLEARGLDSSREAKILDEANHCSLGEAKETLSNGESHVEVGSKEESKSDVRLEKEDRSKAVTMETETSSSENVVMETETSESIGSGQCAIKNSPNNKCKTKEEEERKNDNAIEQEKSEKKEESQIKDEKKDAVDTKESKIGPQIDAKPGSDKSENRETVVKVTDDVRSNGGADSVTEHVKIDNEASSMAIDEAEVGEARKRQCPSPVSQSDRMSEKRRRLDTAMGRSTGGSGDHTSSPCFKCRANRNEQSLKEKMVSGISKFLGSEEALKVTILGKLFQTISTLQTTINDKEQTHKHIQKDLLEMSIEVQRMKRDRRAQQQAQAAKVVPKRTVAVQVNPVQRRTASYGGDAAAISPGSRVASNSSTSTAAPPPLQQTQPLQQQQQQPQPQYANNRQLQPGDVARGNSSAQSIQQQQQIQQQHLQRQQLQQQQQQQHRQSPLTGAGAQRSAAASYSPRHQQYQRIQPALQQQQEKTPSKPRPAPGPQQQQQQQRPSPANKLQSNSPAAKLQTNSPANKLQTKEPTIDLTDDDVVLMSASPASSSKLPSQTPPKSGQGVSAPTPQQQAPPPPYPHQPPMRGRRPRPPTPQQHQQQQQQQIQQQQQQQTAHRMTMMRTPPPLMQGVGRPHGPQSQQQIPPGQQQQQRVMYNPMVPNAAPNVPGGPPPNAYVMLPPNVSVSGNGGFTPVQCAVPAAQPGKVAGGMQPVMLMQQQQGPPQQQQGGPLRHGTPQQHPPPLRHLPPGMSAGGPPRPPPLQRAPGPPHHRAPVPTGPPARHHNVHHQQQYSSPAPRRNVPTALPEHVNMIKKKFLCLKPTLSIQKTPQGIVLQWNMAKADRDTVSHVRTYQLYAYHESSRTGSAQWKKIGDVNALPLPMACTLTQFHEGSRYHFAVRASLDGGDKGPFSDPTIMPE